VTRFQHFSCAAEDRILQIEIQNVSLIARKYAFAFSTQSYWQGLCTAQSISSHAITPVVMHIYESYMIVCLILVLGFCVDATLFGIEYDPRTLKPGMDHNRIRSLRAATTKSSIKARSIEGCLEREIDLHYLDGNSTPVYTLRQTG
jgi:hypothetical protein